MIFDHSLMNKKHTNN